MRPVHVGRVEEVDAKFQRAVNRGDRFRVVSAGIELAHSHASEPDGGDHRTVTAKSSCLHISELSSRPRQAAGRLYASRLHMSSEIEKCPARFPESNLGTTHYRSRKPETYAPCSFPQHRTRRLILAPVKARHCWRSQATPAPISQESNWMPIAPKPPNVRALPLST